MISIPEGSPDRQVRHWTSAEAEGAERMRQAKLRRQHLRASNRRRGSEKKGVASFTTLQRWLFLSIEMPKRLHGFWGRPKKIPLPERI